MTEISFHHNSEKKLTGISARGHSGDGPEGESIVCAAISTVFEILLAGAEDLPATAVCFKENKEKAERKFAVRPDKLTAGQWEQYSRILRAARKVLKQTAEKYPRHCSIS